MSIKQSLLHYFTWWNGANFNTRFYTNRHGELVGHDEFGNAYYRTRGGAIDPSLGFQRRWEAELDAALAAAELLAWPTLATYAPPLEEFRSIDGFARTTEINLAGLPALAQPVPSAGPLPAGLQLVGPLDGEERLVATGALVEAAVGT